MYYAQHVFICTNQKDEGKKCCANGHAKEIHSYLKTKLVAHGLHGPEKIRVSSSGCLGRCGLGPCIVIYPEGIWYSYTSEQDIDEIIESQLIANKPVERLLIDKSLHEFKNKGDC